jgi:Mrp family chromosome partitioning ATPase/capsular polysaccharide biosynthesis protein
MARTRKNAPSVVPGENNSAEWLQPSSEEEGLRRYVETIRERIWWVIIAVVITTGAAAGYVATAEKSYEAEAQLLITPVPATDPILASLGLLVESSDPTRDVETATQLVKNPQVAAIAKTQLGSPDTPQELLDKISSDPIAQSNLITVTARAATPEEARDLANTFAAATVQQRTAAFQAEVNQRLDQLEKSGGATSAADVSELRALQGAPDPNFRVQTQADLPSSPAWPRPVLSIAAGILAGLVLGIAGAFLSQTLDPTLRRESQLKRLYRLPILARIPRQSGRSTGGAPLGPRQLSSAASEAYRTLRATVAKDAEGRGGAGQVILVTGASSSEAKSTTAINLSSALALTGQNVILIEADLRRPSIGPALDIAPKPGGVISVLIESKKIQDALITSPHYGPNMKMLLAGNAEGAWVTDLFSIPAARTLVEDARRLADFVVIDSPPLNEVVDALPLARWADDVLLVAKLGRTHLQKLQQLAELLAESDITPVGFALVGTAKPSRRGYHYALSGEGSDRRSLYRETPERT